MAQGAIKKGTLPVNIPGKIGKSRLEMRRVIFIFLFSPNEQWGEGGGGYAARLLLLFSFPCSADHERDWLPCKVVFSGWQPIC